MTSFETSVRIARPLDEVFAFASDPLSFPRWNSAVRAVRQTRGRGRAVDSTYAMERELPSGRVHNDLEVFAHEHPTRFGIRTTSGPTPFGYRYEFAHENGETVVLLKAALELKCAKGLLAGGSGERRQSRLCCAKGSPGGRFQSTWPGRLPASIGSVSRLRSGGALATRS